MENYGNCDRCGAEKVKSPKTGKIFCSAKCWLNTPGQATSTAPSDTNERIIKGLTMILEVLREIRDK